MEDLYLTRKVEEQLIEWKKKKSHLPLLLKGIRQCGKTKCITHFAEKNYRNTIEINFWKNSSYISIFDGELDVDKLIASISLLFPGEKIIPGKTLLFFDEIQDCPRARLSFKSFALDGRYDVIGSGSYLGISGYVNDDATPIPSGYEEEIEMKTMDFEEFLWAEGYNSEQVSSLYDCFKKRIPVSNAMHEVFTKRFREYLCVGGFPAAVKAYLENKNILDGIKIVQQTIADIKSDFGRRKNKYGLPVFSASEVNKIHQAFDLIPAFLGKENKRFIVSKLNGGSSESKVNAIDYLKQASIVGKVFNLETPSLPLPINEISSQFKLFPTDISILVSMLGMESVASIYSGELGQAKGMIYESLVFDSLYKSGIQPFYFAKESGLEIDFVISYKNCSTLIEAKAKNGNTKSSKTVMSHPEHYGKTQLIKITSSNLSLENGILTIPHYMTFLLGKEQKEFCEKLLTN